MKVMLAEYSVCTGMDGEIRKEGAAMLTMLRQTFEKAGCTILTPRDFDGDFHRIASEADCGLVIAPDDLLAEYTEIIEKSCTNLGAPPAAIRLCADKLETTRLLVHNGLPAPRIVTDGRVKCVVKPRYGCASEGIFISDEPVEKEGFISTEFIEGEHMSVSLIGGKDRVLPLTLNRQHIRIGSTIEYDGNEVNVSHPAKREILGVAAAAGRYAGCRGLFGVDIVYGDRPFVVDINPRPTTAFVGVTRVIETNLADLIILARFGTLPDKVKATGSYSFTKKDLEACL